MRWLRMMALAAGWLALSLLGIAPAAADVLVSIDKGSQRMTVTVDGEARYSWAVSTGTGGGPPAGSYRPERLERAWYSRTFGNAPMPYSIFFHGPYAIHGTTAISRLGHPASHGCVRLHPANARTLFTLVQREGAGNTRIVVTR